MEKYVLRVEIELDPREAWDHPSACETAMTQFAEFGLGQLHQPIRGVTVKLQKRTPGAPPASVKVTR